MSDLAIRVEKLGKRYRIGAGQPGYRTFREALIDGVTVPINRIRGRTPPAEDRTIWALRDVSFEVKQGEVLGIIGRNGAGKSTLLKILSRITEPTEGRAELDGRVGSLLEVGTGFHPELSGRENIYLNGAILGMKRSEIQRRFDEIVAFAEVEQFIDTPVKHYSSGMYMRLAFAVAAHLEPDILMIDEVLAVGDAAFQTKCLAKMQIISGTLGRTVVFVSHNMAAIAAICPRAILLHTGSITTDGSANHVIGQYQSSSSRKQASFADLTKWPNRYGPGEFARFASVALHDLKGTPCDVIQMTQGLVIRLHIHFLKPVGAPEIGVAISNLLGQRATHLVSAWEGLLEPVDAGLYVYEITIPRLLLVPGPYALTLWAKTEGRMSGGSDDGIEGALNFEVTPAAIDGRVPYFDAYCQPGEVYMESQWRVGRA